MPNRKHPIHFVTSLNKGHPIIQFITVCTRSRKPILADKQSMNLLKRVWKQSTTWQVGRYVIMPDHIHIFCAPSTYPPESLGPWVSWWKAVASREWPQPMDAPIWQKNYWDRQLRSSDNYSQKWDYIRMNPVRAGLVEHPDDWPFQGEMNPLPW
ncbi:MAG: transposase [Puniceicoccaceae bacterium]